MTKVSGTGQVPALIDGDVQVWESLAILEYLAEKFPQARLWAANPAARARARAIAAEMHAGFVPLRRKLPMNFWRPKPFPDRQPSMLPEAPRVAPPPRQLPAPDDQQRRGKDQQPQIQRIRESNRIQVDARQHLANP